MANSSDMRDDSYRSIVSHYEACLEKHGDTHLGVDWPTKQDADTRYRVMLEVIRSFPTGENIRLLDFGCGGSHLNDYLERRGVKYIAYSGLDLSPKFVELSKRKYPANVYYCLDLLDQRSSLPLFDYIVMNGVFTEKRELSFDDMFAYCKRLLKKVFAQAEVGIAFNVMSKQVDWERDDLFYLPFDKLAEFLTKELTRNFVFRNDYGLYEYTTYLYR